MSGMSPQAQLEGFIDRYTLEVAGLARAALARMREILPGANLLVYDNYNALAIGFGPNERSSDAVFSIALYPRWVSLFFLQGAGLPVPERILRGSGTKARHVVLVRAGDLDTVPLRSLMAAALAHARVPIDPAGEGQLIIKSISSSQRPRTPA